MAKLTNLLRAAPFLLLLLLLLALPAWAQESNALPRPKIPVSLSEMFTFFFLMLGPLKILGPFVHLTHGADAKFIRRLALRAFFYSCLALLAAAFAGENSMRKYHISVPVLAIAAGVILFLVALRTVMEQYETRPTPPPEAVEHSVRLAVTPLAFPIIVTPYGVAAVIICVTLTPDYLTKGAIFGALLGLMLLNLVAMLYARPVLKYLGMPMQLVGTVLGIIQVALGLQIIVAGLRGLGVHFEY